MIDRRYVLGPKGGLLHIARTISLHRVLTMCGRDWSEYTECRAINGDHCRICETLAAMEDATAEQTS